MRGCCLRGGSGSCTMQGAQAWGSCAARCRGAGSCAAGRELCPIGATFGGSSRGSSSYIVSSPVNAGRQPALNRRDERGEGATTFVASGARGRRPSRRAGGARGWRPASMLHSHTTERIFPLLDLPTLPPGSSPPPLQLAYLSSSSSTSAEAWTTPTSLPTVTLGYGRSYHHGCGHGGRSVGGEVQK